MFDFLIVKYLSVSICDITHHKTLFFMWAWNKVVNEPWAAATLHVDPPAPRSDDHSEALMEYASSIFIYIWVLEQVEPLLTSMTV